MRSVNTDSAAFPGGSAWDQVDWPIVHRRVRGLQIRIAKATRDQDWRRVKALQRFLVNSYSAKALAVKRVSENDGKRTPGVDGEIWTTPEAKWRAIQRLDSRGLRPQPLRRVYIPKRGSTTEKRPLGIPVMIDRAHQALHLQGLEPVAETQADPHSYGFRRNRGTQDAIARVFNLLVRKTSASWILEGDIRGCFDQPSQCPPLEPTFLSKVSSLSLPALSLRSAASVAGLSGKRYNFVRASRESAMVLLWIRS
jgi:RNA-directed DNA polymerase